MTGHYEFTSHSWKLGSFSFRDSNLVLLRRSSEEKVPGVLAAVSLIDSYCRACALFVTFTQAGVLIICMSRLANEGAGGLASVALC